MKNRRDEILLNKAEVRQRAQDERRNTDAEHLEKESGAVVRAFLELPAYRSADMVCCYASEQHEIDTWGLMESILSDGKRLCLPKTMGRGEMEMCEVSSLSVLVPGRLSIPEPPQGCRVVPKEEIDLCIVPCVACSKTGVRVGRGAGYYDRYLKDTRCKKIAFCRDSCLYDAVSPDEHDVLMDLIISCGEVYNSDEA